MPVAMLVTKQEQLPAFASNLYGQAFLCVYLQVTTHSHLLSHDELQCVKDTISIDVAAFLLNEFDTELDFSNKIRCVLYTNTSLHWCSCQPN